MLFSNKKTTFCRQKVVVLAAKWKNKSSRYSTSLRWYDPDQVRRVL